MHPHSSEDGSNNSHNGIIENSVELASKVSKLGHSLASETDTEVIVHLLDHELKTQGEKSHLDALLSNFSTLWLMGNSSHGLRFGGFSSQEGSTIGYRKSPDSISVSSDVLSMGLVKLHT